MKYFHVIFLLMLSISSIAQTYFYQTLDDVSIQGESIEMLGAISTSGGGMLSYGTINESAGVLVAMDSAGVVIWKKRYDNIDNELIFETVFETDSFYYVGGTIDSYPQNAILLKTDKNGNILDTKIIKGPDQDFSITKMVSFGSKIVISCRHDNPQSNIFLLQMDSLGNFNVLNSNTALFFINDMVADDKYLYVVGHSEYLICEYNLGLIAKLDHDGNILWMQDYKIQSNGSTQIESILVNDDHSITIFGSSIKQPCSDGRIFFVRLDTAGSELYKKEYALNYEAFAENLFIKKDDNTYLSAHHISLTTDSNLLLIEYDSNFNINWSYRYSQGESCNPRGLVSLASGSIFVAGSNHYSSPQQLPRTSFIMKLPADGNSCNRESFVPLDYNHQLIISYHNEQEDGDASFSVSSISVTASDPFLLYEVCGNPTGVQEVKAISDHVMFPNPFHSSFEVHVDEPGKTQLDVYDLSGKVMLTSSFHSSIKLGEQLQPGMYITRLLLPGNKTIIRKMIKI